MLKKLIALAVLTTSIAIGLGVYSQPATTQQIDLATLSGKAALALAQGESEVTLVVHDSFDGIDSLNAALARYTVIEATPISKTSYVLDQFSIGTWYKFRVHRTLKQNALPACSDCSSVPDPPTGTTLNSDEIMVLHGGGLQVVDGVTFRVTVPDYPDFSLNQRYLLFIDYDDSKKVGMVSVGPPGVYIVDGFGRLAHIYNPDPDDPIGAGLVANYSNNVNTLNIALNPPPPPPPSPSCDPLQEENCLNMRRSWDPENCQCAPYMWELY